MLLALVEADQVLAQRCKVIDGSKRMGSWMARVVMTGREDLSKMKHAGAREAAL